MDDGIEGLLHRQDGVVSRKQLMDLGLGDPDIRRLIRRRSLARIHQGVYVNHTGPVTDRQRAWAAVLSLWPAALARQSAISLGGRPIHIAISHTRFAAPPEGVVLHRVRGFEAKALLNLSPPRMRVEEAVLDCAAEAKDEFELVALLSGVVGNRATTVPRIRSAMTQRTRLARRSLIDAVLTDIAEGTCSTLERAYLHYVERPHRLPRPKRQHRPEGLRVIRDADYEDFGVVIELDGRAFHDNATARDSDLERDLDARVHDVRETIRLGWGQVVRRPCSTAVKVGALLQRKGWRGRPTRCPRCS